MYSVLSLKTCAILFHQDLKKYGATTVVRVCEITYDKSPLEKDGITVMVRYISFSYCN